MNKRPDFSNPRAQRLGGESVAVESQLKIGLIGIGSETFLSDLDAAGIKYRRYLPIPGVVTNSGIVIELAAILIPSAAVVLAGWIAARPSRDASVTHVNLTITHINNGMSADDVAKLLRDADNVTVMETKKPDAIEKCQP